MQIFLSYASEQKAEAETIAFALRKRGHKVFLDKDDLPPGRSYDDQIQRAVFAADLMIFLISPESVAPGRYTLTELEYARHHWSQPDRTVLPVMLRRTEMARVPAFLKAVTIQEPSGNLAAEVAFWVDQLRGRDYILRITGWFALAGTIAGLAYWGTKEGWFGFPEIPYAKFAGLTLERQMRRAGLNFGGVSTAVDVAFVVILVGCLMPAGLAMTAVARLVVSASWWRALIAGSIVALMTGTSVLTGAEAYRIMESPYNEIMRLDTELKVARRELARRDNATVAAENDEEKPSTTLERAMSLEWAMIRLRVALLYGFLFGAGMLAAGAVISPALHSSRRWALTLAAAAATAGTSYMATNSLAASFLLFHIGIFSLIGY